MHDKGTHRYRPPVTAPSQQRIVGATSSTTSMNTGPPRALRTGRRCAHRRVAPPLDEHASSSTTRIGSARQLGSSNIVVVDGCCRPTRPTSQPIQVEHDLNLDGSGERRAIATTRLRWRSPAARRREGRNESHRSSHRWSERHRSSDRPPTRCRRDQRRHARSRRRRHCGRRRRSVRRRRSRHTDRCGRHRHQQRRDRRSQRSTVGDHRSRLGDNLCRQRHRYVQCVPGIHPRNDGSPVGPYRQPRQHGRQGRQPRRRRTRRPKPR